MSLERTTPKLPPFKDQSLKLSTQTESYLATPLSKAQLKNHNSSHYYDGEFMPLGIASLSINNAEILEKINFKGKKMTDKSRRNSSGNFVKTYLDKSVEENQAKNETKKKAFFQFKNFLFQPVASMKNKAQNNEFMMVSNCEYYDKDFKKEIELDQVKKWKVKNKMEKLQSLIEQERIRKEKCKPNEGKTIRKLIAVQKKEINPAFIFNKEAKDEGSPKIKLRRNFLNFTKANLQGKNNINVRDHLHLGFDQCKVDFKMFRANKSTNNQKIFSPKRRNSKLKEKKNELVITRLNLDKMLLAL